MLRPAYQDYDQPEAISVLDTHTTACSSCFSTKDTNRLSLCRPIPSYRHHSSDPAQQGPVVNSVASKHFAVELLGASEGVLAAKFTFAAPISTWAANLRTWCCAHIYTSDSCSHDIQYPKGHTVQHRIWPIRRMYSECQASVVNHQDRVGTDCPTPWQAIIRSHLR